jgi:hypothetical protein
MKKIIILISLTFLFLIPNSYIGQGWGQQGGPWGPGGPGGPPPPPDQYCQQFPDDPACNGTSVPVGSTEGMLIFAFLAGTFFIYKLNGNSFKFNKS